MDAVTYKGFEIHAAPYRLAETGQWRIKIHIARDRGNQREEKGFSGCNSYPTREEAVEHCFQLGRQIIDGQVANCSVAYL